MIQQTFQVVALISSDEGFEALTLILMQSHTLNSTLATVYVISPMSVNYTVVHLEWDHLVCRTFDQLYHGLPVAHLLIHLS